MNKLQKKDELFYMVKILFIINTLGGGGAEKVLIDLVNSLPKGLYDVTILTLIPGVHDTSLAPYVKHKIILNSPFRIVHIFGIKFLCKLLPYHFFAKLFIGNNYDIVVSYLEGFPSRVVASLSSKVKKVTFVHCDVSLNNSWLKIYKSIEQCRKEYELFDRICFVSENSRDAFFKKIGVFDNAIVLHNVVNISNVLNSAKERIDEKYITNGLKLITSGRMVETKSFDRLLNVVYRLNQENYDFELWILGEGLLRQKLETQIKEQNLKNVRLLGFQNNPYKYISCADLYVCSSLTEGYSTAVIESILMGLPVLTTECAGMKEILLNGKYGDIVSNSEDGLFEGIKKNLTDKSHFNNLKLVTLERSKQLRAEDTLSEYKKLFNSLYDTKG